MSPLRVMSIVIDPLESGLSLLSRLVAARAAAGQHHQGENGDEDERAVAHDSGTSGFLQWS